METTKDFDGWNLSKVCGKYSEHTSSSHYGLFSSSALINLGTFLQKSWASSYQLNQHVFRWVFRAPQDDFLGWALRNPWIKLDFAPIPN